MKRPSFIPLLGALAAAVIGSGSAHAATLIHAYDFNSGVVDSVGGQNGTLLNGALVANGALQLDGFDDYVQFASHIVPTSGSMSVAFWGLRISTGTFAEFISQGQSGGPGFYIGNEPNGNVRLTDLVPGPGTGVPAGASGEWVHYALTVDAAGSSTRFYMNGAQVWSTNTAFQTGAGGTDTRLGRQFQPFAEYMRGSMDDLNIYTGALTAAEVNGLAQVRNATVPEPATLWLVGLGGLAALRRRSLRLPRT